MRMTLAHALLFAGPEPTGGRASGPFAELQGITVSELLTQLRDGDEAAFATLYRLFHPRLVAIAEAYVHSAAIAEELAQDTLLVAWDRRAQWVDDNSLVIYLYATVRNRALKHLRHEGIVGRVGAAARMADHALGVAAGPDAPDRVASGHDLQTIMLRAVQQLPEMQQAAFALRWIHQLDYAEIAAVMGITPAAVRQHVSRARATLLPLAQRLIG